MPKATITQVKEFFGIETKQMMSEWKNLSTDEQNYFKEEVGKELN